jgi:hypothetical protein
MNSNSLAVDGKGRSTMNTRTRARAVVTTCVATIFIAGIGVAPAAEAKRDTIGGGTAAVPAGQADGIDMIVADRKVRMAHDYVAYAAARARWAAQH